MIRLYDLTVENERLVYAAPCRGIRYGWKIASDETGVFQTGYRIRIYEGDFPIYDSAYVEGADCFGVCPDIEYSHGKQHRFTVEVLTNKGSTEASLEFSTGLDNEDFNAKWVAAGRHIEGASVYFRGEYTAKKPVKRAMLYAVGLGYGDVYLNGRKVSDSMLETPFTNYEKEVLYRAYDVTGQICGDFCVGIHAGEGFYSQSRVWVNKAFKYGDICALTEIRLEYEDGTEDIFFSDGDWKYAYSPAVLSNVHAGEIYDARYEIEDWCKFGCAREHFLPVKLAAPPSGVLKGAVMPPVRKLRSVRPVSVNILNGEDGGIWIYDMGENFAGVVTLRPPKSAAGSTYVLRFAECLDSSGHLDCRSIGVYHVYCQQQDIFISAGRDNEEWTPSFTYHSFRYVEVTGFYGREPSLDLIEGVALGTDLCPVGNITTSNEDLNNVHKIMMRTILSNYHGFPEDCPAREKCGWLGDAQIVSDTALYNFDILSSYEKYLSDIRTSRQVYGDWTMIAPGKRTCGYASPLWGCAQIIIPYNMYLYRGDLWALSEYYPDMKMWVQHECGRAPGYIISEGLGDWAPPVGSGSKYRIPVPHSSTLMFYEETVKLAEIAGILGHTEDREEYLALAERIRQAFIEKFYNRESHSYGYQASNAAAVLLGVYPEGERDALIASTVKMIKELDYVMTTGIYGNKYLIPMLVENGLGDVAMKILFGRGHKSLGTMMDDGGTSLWECLEMLNVDSPSQVSSFNHPMHSGFAYFYYAHLAGIRPTEAGFRKFEIRPCLIPDCEEVRAEYESPYGKIASCRCGNIMTVTVPVGTECTLTLPRAEESITLCSGTYTFEF